MNKKSLLCFLLTAAMLFSLAVCGSGAALAETPDIDAQLGLIQSKLDTLKQNDGGTWYYTVADLNHNGCLEFIAAHQHKIDRSANLKVWEVSADGSTLNECTLDKDPEESFPDILTDSTDTYHDPVTDTWSYMFYDNIMLSPREVYTSKSAYHLKDGVVGYAAYAVEHTVSENGVRNVSHTDANGITISPEQYNAAGVEAFAGAERSNTSFDWIKAEDLGQLSRLADSYAVFTGRKAPTEVFPVPKIEVVDQPAAPAAPAEPIPTLTPASAAAPAQNTQPLYLSVTKNSTNESKNEGGTAVFVSCANAFESLSWTLVAPNGGEYTVANFRNVFPRANISGEYSTTLNIGNVDKDMNNWGAYCTFYYKGQTARTSTAYMYVSGKAQPKTIPSGTYSGTVVDWAFSTVTLSIEGVNATISWDICDVVGDLYYGAPAWVTWNGSNITYCYIQGSKAAPQPSSGAMSGTIYSDTASTVYVVLQNGTGLHLSAWLVNWVTGSVLDGASCTVYYSGYPSESTVYQIDVYGYEQPSSGSVNGTAYEGGGGFAINCDNGVQVFADSWLCNVSGTFVDGSRCTVYYNGSLSNANIYQVDIYGSYDQGGWAGSNYYDQGGWAGSNYWENELSTAISVYGYETDNYVLSQSDGYLGTHVSFNLDGSTYEAVWCPECGAEVSLAMEQCPVCGHWL